MKMWPIFVGTVQPHIFGGDQVKLTPCAKKYNKEKQIKRQIAGKIYWKFV